MRTGCSELFELMELLIGGCEVIAVSVDLPYLLSIRIAQLHARFSVEGRGASYRLEWPKDPFEGKICSVEIVTKPLPHPAGK